MSDHRSNDAPANHGEVVSLREYFLALLAEMDIRNKQRFDAQERAVQAALAGAERAVTKAEIAVEKRLEGMNEFRAALSDQAARLMSRGEAEQRMTTLEKSLDALVNRVTANESSGTGLRAGWGYLLGAIGGAGGLISLLFMLYSFWSRAPKVTTP